MTGSASPSILSLAALLADRPAPEPCLIEPGLLPSQGILFIGGEPKAGKSLLVANLALALAAGGDHAGFNVPTPRRVLIFQFELPTPQFALRLSTMRKAIGSHADSNLFVDTRAGGHLLSAPAGLNHFLNAARSVQAEVLVIDPLYSTHDQDENDTRAMACRIPWRPDFAWRPWKGLCGGDLRASSTRIRGRSSRARRSRKDSGRKATNDADIRRSGSGRPRKSVSVETIRRASHLPVPPGRWEDLHRSASEGVFL